MRAYIAIPFKGGKNTENIERLCLLAKRCGFEDFCFVRDVHKKFRDPKELMREARREIKNSDVLLIDMSDTTAGCAIEAGIAFEVGKRIVSLVKRGQRIKSTTRGISDAVIEYENFEDIVGPLSSLFLSWSEKLF